jgi:nucleoside-diphosphate-sugar epimerase
MKVLLTGATGFLGKRVLEILVADERVSKILVISRKGRPHPSSKVISVRADLSDPKSLNVEFTCEPDAVIHLAGLYDFSSSFTENYNQNVLSTLNLIDRIRSRAALPLLIHASTYAVGLGHATASDPLDETVLRHLPPRDCPYAFTKAVAERAVHESGIPARVLRLGVLVGDSSTGDMEKIDGPYAIMRTLQRLARVPGVSRLPRLPLPVLADAVLPLVPVDSAARIAVQCLFLDKPVDGACVYHSVYRPDSIAMGELARSIFTRYLPGTEPVFLSSRLAKRVPAWLLPLQSGLTGVPGDVFRFTLDPVALAPLSGLTTAFGDDCIPPYAQYSETLFSEYERWFA